MKLVVKSIINIAEKQKEKGGRNPPSFTYTYPKLTSGDSGNRTHVLPSNNNTSVSHA
jgi:hypothetical protein